MAIRTKGDLKNFTTRDESTYGTFNTSGTSKYGGVLSGWDDGMSVDMAEDYPQAEGETFSDVVACAKTYGFSADMTIPRGQGILAAWLKRATGSSSGQTGPKNDITPFSATFHKGASEELAYFGCKLDSFSIKGDGRGKPIQFSASAFSRYMAIATTTTFSNLGTSVSFAQVSRPSGSPITYCAPVKLGNTDLKAKSWSLTISNGLQREEDAVIVSTVCYPLSAGLDSVPTDREITLEITRAVDGATWDTNSYNGLTGQTLSVVLDGITITLTGAYLVPSMSKASQSAYDETLTFKAKTITYTTS